MWYSSRGSKKQAMLILRFFLLVICISNIVNGDRSVIERIKKHQEWLKQRNQQKQKMLEERRNLKHSIELPNLWRFPKEDRVNAEKSSKNDVYPENEIVITTTSTESNTIPTTTTMTATTTAAASTEAQFSDNATLAPVIYVDATTATMPITLTTTTTTTAEPETTTTTTQFPSTTTTTTALPIKLTPTTTTTKPKSKQRGYPRWGNWSQWSDCSRSCGGGVMFQQRKCINRNSSTGKRYVSNDCSGIYRRYQLCNDEPCPSGVLDFRSQQCAAYNDVDFQGQKYTWEPHIKDDAECELNCKPLGMKYFATLNATVIDGTSCQRPAEYYRSNYRGRAVCVDGICKVIEYI